MIKANFHRAVRKSYPMLLIVLTSIRPAVLFVLLLSLSLNTAALLAILTSLLSVFSYIIQFEAHRNSVLKREFRSDWVTGVFLRWICVAPIFWAVAMWFGAHWVTALLFSIASGVDAIVNVEQKLVSFFNSRDKDKVSFLAGRFILFVLGVAIGFQFGSALEAFAIGIILQIAISKATWLAWPSSERWGGDLLPTENVALFAQGVGSRLHIFGERAICAAIFSPEIVLLMTFAQSAVGFLGAAFEMKTNSTLAEICNEDIKRSKDWTIKAEILRKSFGLCFRTLWRYASYWVIGSAIAFILAVLIRSDVGYGYIDIAALIFVITAATMITGHLFAQSSFLSGQDFTIGVFFWGYLIVLAGLWYFEADVIVILWCKIIVFVFTLVAFLGGATPRPLRLPYPRKFR